MSNKLVITKQKDQIISSLLEGNELVQVNASEAVTESLLGNIYVGKVKNIVKNISAAFVEIQPDLMCYYSLEENKSPIYVKEKKNDKLVIGDELIVQVTKENIKTKAPVISSNFSLTGKYSVLTHGKTNIGISGKIRSDETRERLKNLLLPYQNEEYGFVIRTNAADAPEEYLINELEGLIEKYKEIKQFGVHKTIFSKLYESPAPYICDIRDGAARNIDAIVTDEVDIYENMKDYVSRFQREDLEKLEFYQDPMISLNNLYGISSKLEKALREHVWLKSGGYLVIQPTEALTVIDVNTGKAIAGKKKAEETFFKINKEAAVEIAKQMHLRNLSGIIIIDFIDMLDENNKNELLKQLRDLCAKDPIKTTLIDMTPLNLVEITRKKVRKPLHEQIKG
ncbi:cytoplasmic axial filament protein CafA and ribonuclease G [Lachnospiraceae bacterium KM106-2]|nr:cytoplasmic axial filament protein CafA and ribonuclease G [Lachnospiraceae bacterium KM106-2]